MSGRCPEPEVLRLKAINVNLTLCVKSKGDPFGNLGAALRMVIRQSRTRTYRLSVIKKKHEAVQAGKRQESLNQRVGPGCPAKAGSRGATTYRALALAVNAGADEGDSVAW